MVFEDRSLLERSIDLEKQYERSPFVEGFIRGTKAALIAAPTGAFIQALRGKNPLVGAAVGGIGAGLVAGVAAAGEKKVLNLEREAEIRYHTQRIKEREPMFFMPPPEYMQALAKKVLERG